MATTAEKKILRKKLEKYEGRIDYIYKDSVGNLTIGVGHLLKDIDAAQKINFIHQSDGKKATKDEIKKDYDEVKKQTYIPEETAASKYKQHTKLKISSDTIDSQTNDHIASFEKELKRLYGSSKFDKFPSDVKLALFDMIFNLGMTTLKKDFPNFNKAIKANNWAQAAKESHRKTVNDSRNKYVKDKLNKAAQSKKAKETASNLKSKKDEKIMKDYSDKSKSRKKNEK
ncbi:glycoside hydrolase family protein [Vibrio quintilis]|uniref:Lysozyme n=1 Tax=Vibrio quintilis TaxID=1117707 RepID=A0A1M7YSC0_9VIBR|nr:hypothetical protein [Vibrio quintilis]SHO55426.1 hypothetical protein VQ7734_01154 [Vibrio quintilis]